MTRSELLARLRKINARSLHGDANPGLMRDDAEEALLDYIDDDGIAEAFYRARTLRWHEGLGRKYAYTHGCLITSETAAALIAAGAAEDLEQRRAVSEEVLSAPETPNEPLKYAILPLERCGEVETRYGRYWCYLCNGNWRYSKYDEPLVVDLWGELAEHLRAAHDAQEC